MTAPGMRRVAAASFVGTAIEWYDFLLYGTMSAVVFSRLFFPALDPAAGTLAAFATFAVGFLARPLGGILFGHFGDRTGRKATLVASLLLMGVSTMLIGALPTYDVIGVWAPVILTVLRFAQGFALGGEWAGAASLTVEHAPEDRRGFYGAFVQIGGPVGGVLSSLTVLALSRGMSQDAFLGWGWRVPFLVAAVLVVVGLVIRLRVEESPVFRAVRGQGTRRLPVADALRRHGRTILLVTGVYLAPATVTNIVAVFLLSYGAGTGLYVQNEMLLAYVIATASLLVVNPVIGWASDAVGRRPVILAGTVLTIPAAFLLFALVDTGRFGLALVGVILLQAANYLMYMPQAAFFVELFEPEVRVSGASIGVQVATVVAGGTAPLIAQSLLAVSGGASWAVAAFVAGVGLVSTVATLLTRETRRPVRTGTATGARPAPLV